MSFSDLKLSPRYLRPVDSEKTTLIGAASKLFTRDYSLNNENKQSPNIITVFVFIFSSFPL